MVTLDWTALLDVAAATALRNALQSLGDEPVFCPAWPFTLKGADWSTSKITAQC